MSKRQRFGLALMIWALFLMFLFPHVDQLAATWVVIASCAAISFGGPMLVAR